MRIDIIGSQMDLGAFRKGVNMGPLAIRYAQLVYNLKQMGCCVKDHGDIVPLIAEDQGKTTLRYEREINDANYRLYLELKEILSKNDDSFTVVLGGDHSISIGSIPAVCEKYGKLGIIWVDAHGDFNDNTISPTGNIHGMPLSAVCGCGPDSLMVFSEARINPQNAAIIGARDLDFNENIKLKSKGVNVYSISDIHTRGIREIIDSAISAASNGTDGIYLSFDMDALDPEYAPGVGTPVVNGLTIREAFMICEALYKSNKLVGLDLVETNPLLDTRNKTGVLASELILSCIGKTMY